MGGRPVDPEQLNKLEFVNGALKLNGSYLPLKFGRRGVKVGCTFVTYEALDKIYEQSKENDG